MFLCRVLFFFRTLYFALYHSQATRVNEDDGMIMYDVLHIEPRKPLTPSLSASVSVNVAYTFKIGNSSKDNPCRRETRVKLVLI